MSMESRRKLRDSLEAYAYLAPSLIVLGIFWFLPVAVSLVMSFGDMTALKPLSQIRFVGLRQYVDAFSDPVFRQTLWNTVNYVIYSVPLTLVISLAGALLLNSLTFGRGVFRTIFFIPYITTWVAISIVFSYIFHREFGLGNWLLGVISTDLLRLENPWRLEFLEEGRGIWEMMLPGVINPVANAMPFGSGELVKGPSLSAFCIIMTSVWRDVGYFMIIFLAGLQNIDKSLYEAASIDGAGSVEKFKAVTFPLLSPVSFFLLIISMISAFKVFVPQFMMTPDGGPGRTTMPLTMLLYQQGFTGEWKLSYASAIAYILTLIILILTILQNRAFGRRVEYGH